MQSKRRLRRFYSAVPLPLSGNKVILSQEESSHLRNVIRLQEGESCLLTDGQGRQGEAVIDSFLPDGTIELKMVSEAVTGGNSTIQIRFFQAIPRLGKFDVLVQKAQELGLDELCPLESERTIVRIDPKKGKSKLARWERIAREAAKQCGAARLIHIEEPKKLSEAVSLIGSGEQVVLFHPSAESETFRGWFVRLEKAINQKTAGRLNVFLGPEGGFSEEEVSFLKASQKKADRPLDLVHLGSRILRSDTAFIGVLAALKFMVEERAYGK